ncbi:hypothetical protein [Muriicola sp.]|uniref:hypothetical protein n=1 Tax=Muriicola sp. TaxID=2020856 RepID=UPI003C72C97D
MKKVVRYFFVSFYLFVSFSCSSEESDNTTFSPPSMLLGTWKAPLEEEQYMRLTIKKSTLIEENYTGAYSNIPYIDFSKDYDLDTYIVTQKIDDSSYEFTIQRKDGGIMDVESGSLTIFRKYRLVNFNDQVALELMYQGTFGAYLIRE